MKICVIGNSQIAAIKGGWEIVRHTQPGVEVTFFGAVRQLWSALEAVDGALVPTTEELQKAMSYTSGGLEQITDDYDRYLLCGLGIGASEFLKFFDTDRKRLLRDDFIEQAAEAMQVTPGMQVMDKVHQITGAPIGLIPAPFHSDDAPESSYGVEISWGAARRLAQRYEDTLSLMSDKDWFQLFLQPAATIARPLFTKSKFSIGANRMHQDRSGAQHGPEDFTHMNAEYGALYWAEILTNRVFLGAFGSETV